MRLGWNGPQWGTVLRLLVSSSSFLFLVLAFVVCWCWRRQTSALLQLSEVPGSCGVPLPGSGTHQLLPNRLWCLCICLAIKITACKSSPIQPLSPSFCRTHNIIENQFSVWISSLSANWALCTISQLPCELLGPMGPAHCPFIIQLKSGSSVLERRLVKVIHKRPKTLAGTRKSKRRNSEDAKGDFNLQTHFLGGI